MSAASNVSAASFQAALHFAQPPQAGEVRRFDGRQDLRGGQRLPTIGQGIDGLQRSARALPAASPRTGQLQPAFDIAGVGGCLGPLAGGRLDGVAQSWAIGGSARQSQLPSESSASLASSSANGAVCGTCVHASSA